MKKDYFVIVNHKALETFLAQAYERVGVSRDDAALLARSLVEASLRGTDSHGVLLFYTYFKLIQGGNPNPSSQMQIVSDTGCTAILNGGNGIGQLVSYHAMQLAIEKAHQYGVGVVGARNSNHYQE